MMAGRAAIMTMPHVSQKIGKFLLTNAPPREINTRQSGRSSHSNWGASPSAYETIPRTNPADRSKAKRADISFHISRGWFFWPAACLFKAGWLKEGNDWDLRATSAYPKAAFSAAVNPLTLSKRSCGFLERAFSTTSSTAGGMVGTCSLKEGGKS